MARRVVFVGGTQAKALSRAFRNEIADQTKDEVSYIGDDALSREGAQRTIAAAAVVAIEIDNLDGREDPREVSLAPPGAQVVLIPTVRADFLWPFAGKPHPKTTGEFPMSGGPYPADQGDSFLDRMMAEGVPHDEAVARYLELDIAQEAGIDRLLEERIARQAILDSRAGYDLADFINTQFRATHLFASLAKPGLPLFRRIAGAMFRKLGVAEVEAQRVSAGLRPGLLTPTSQPIHPGILSHFGITDPTPDHRYAMLEEGRFTFEEACRRYLRFDWNEDLHRGIALVRSNPAEAVGKLRTGLLRSPESPAGKRALRLAQRKAGSPNQAHDADGSSARTEADWIEPAPVMAAVAEAPVEPEASETTSRNASLSHESLQTGERTEAALLPEDLLAGLPDMLRRGEPMSSGGERPFAAMLETMPPPPMDLDLPPDPRSASQTVPRKAGLFTRLGGLFRR